MNKQSSFSPLWKYSIDSNGERSEKMGSKYIGYQMVKKSMLEKNIARRLVGAEKSRTCCHFLVGCGQLHEEGDI